MLAAFDVHYSAQGGARAAAVLFSHFEASAADNILTQLLAEPADYVPGAFYKRELPCILSLLDKLDQEPTVIIIDGYVWLGAKPGLGQHLYEALDGRTPVIGVAKSAFPGASAQVVFRGGSIRPLHVTAAGMPAEIASGNIRRMHGPYRIPTLLKIADQVARGNLAIE